MKNNFKPSKGQYSRTQRSPKRSPKSGADFNPARNEKPPFREYPKGRQIKTGDRTGNKSEYAAKKPSYDSDKFKSCKNFYKKDVKPFRKSQNNNNNNAGKVVNRPQSRISKPVREKYIDYAEKNRSAITEDILENSSMTFGRNAVMELLKSDRTIDKIFVQTNQREGSITKIAAEAIRKAIPVIEVEKSKLDKMINASSHQGVVAMTSEVEYCSVDDIIALAEEKNEKPFILIADKIMDSQNLGAIIRTAECAGVHGIIIPKRHAAGVSSVVNKISAGAVFHIKIAKVSNIALTIEQLKEQGIWVFASTSDSDRADSENKTKKEVKNYYDADYDLPMCLAVGNEGEGLSPIVLQKSDFLINIPMYGKIESLNVSCAAAILLYEIKKQKKS